MAGPPLDAVEREQLCDLFVSLGPDAPTLCEGWKTADLAAHLHLRERNPLFGIAILGGKRTESWQNRMIERAKAKHDYAALVAKVRSGPPRLSIFRVPRLREMINLNEYFIHHEDVRRTNGLEPRTGVDELEAALWKLISRGAGLLTRGVKGVGLELEAPGYGTRTARKGTPTVTLTGSPQEISLYLSGRRGAARVELKGDDAAIDTVANARLGI
jgi:uncharacterized protein (TIGR03085 family)